MAGWLDGRMAGGSVKRTEISKVFIPPRGIYKMPARDNTHSIASPLQKKKNLHPHLVLFHITDGSDSRVAAKGRESCKQFICVLATKGVCDETTANNLRKLA